jgi:hypothetical protein
VREADDLTTFMCRMSRKCGRLNHLEPSGPHRACNGTAVHLPVYYILDFELKYSFIPTAPDPVFVAFSSVVTNRAPQISFRRHPVQPARLQRKTSGWSSVGIVVGRLCKLNCVTEILEWANCIYRNVQQFDLPAHVRKKLYATHTAYP